MGSVLRLPTRGDTFAVWPSGYGFSGCCCCRGAVQKFLAAQARSDTAMHDPMRAQAIQHRAV